MEDIFKPAGATKASKPDAGGGVIRQVPVFGIVKNNVDPTRSGRIQVYISDLGGDDPDDPEQWATVSYMSPFYGFVEPTAGDSGLGDFTANPASYGVWNSPPDLETTVICIFINGDPNYGFYIGSAPKPEALFMVPAIGSSEKVIINNDGESQSYGGASILPVTNINTNNESVSDGDNFLDEAKPVHSYLASILFKQGIIRDTIRGPITTSAQRESPSRVGWGVSSPGRPIYAGGYTDKNIAAAAQSGSDPAGLKIISRRGGHSIVMDDGDLVGKDNLVRMRSAAGHQILMSDDGQTLFIIHSNGQSWIEMGKEGTIDMFCTNSFNVRTQGDINLHADNNINIHAKKNLNIKASDINIESEKATNHKVGSNYKIDTASNYTVKVGGRMSFQSGGEASFAAGGTCYINGSVINLNTGQGAAPEAVQPQQDIAHTDTLFDSVKGYLAAPGKLKSITSRAPAHSPWVNANQGVNIQTSSNASDQLPSAPSAAISKAITNSTASPTGNPISPAVLSTVPPTSAVSQSIDKPTTESLVGAISTNAATGPASAIVKTGAGIVQTATQGAVGAVGNFAMTPAQMDAAGIIKPGSSALVNSLIKSGSTVQNALTNNLFTGKGGTSLGSFISNPAAQTAGLVATMQQAQTALTGSGILTGKESPVAIAGLVMSGATAGLTQTVNGFKDLASGLMSPGKKLAGVSGSVSNALNSGNFAAGLAQSSTAGLGSIASALGVMGVIAGAKLNAKGATAAAFGAIAASLSILPKNSPINLRTLASDGMTLAQARSAGYTNPLQSASEILRQTGQILGGTTGRVAGAVAGGLTSIDRLLGSATPTQSIGALKNVLTSVGSIGTALGNKSLAKATRDVNSIISGGQQLTRALNTLSNSRNTLQTIGAVGGVLSSVGSLGKVFGNKNLAKTTNKINTALNGTTQILRATDTLMTSNNVGQLFGSINSLISGANRIASATSNSSKASGMFSLPGGPLSVGSLVNKSLGSLGIPRNPYLSGMVTNAVTSAINNIAFPKSVAGAAGLSTLAGLSGTSLSNSFNKLQSTGQSLTSFALSGLPPGASAELNAAMGAIGFGGASAIKMPSIGINTNALGEVQAQVTSLLGDARIPAPDFGEILQSATEQLQAIVQQNNKVDGMLDEISNLSDQIDSSQEEYFNLENTLPRGDLKLEAARQQWIALVDQLESKLTSIDNLINSA